MKRNLVKLKVVFIGDYLVFKDKIFGFLVGARDLINDFAVKSYSQEGEDLITARYFGNKKNGFYIDVGANHPKKFSNTYYFYKRGWKGINIDPLPGSKTIFDKLRKNDININLGISDKEGKMIYFMFEEPQLNTFSEKIKKNRLKTGKKLIDKKYIKIKTLSTILNNLKIKMQIDFLTIDTEGFDLNVLKSNNWVKYSPKLIIVEDIDFKLEKYKSSNIFNFLSKKGYVLFAKTGNSLIFEKVD